jgi:hypothetical protein
MKIFLIILCATFILALSTVKTFADGSCLAINNGGITNQQFCPTPAPAQAELPTLAPVNNNQQQNTNQPKNNGDQQVYPPSQTKTTPDTGPEDWSLPALLFLAGTGLFLRKSAKKSS